MLKKDAKLAVQQEYRSWRRQNVDEPSLLFYSHLKSERPDLLKFTASGDEWQVVNGWIQESDA